MTKQKKAKAPKPYGAVWDAVLRDDIDDLKKALDRGEIFNERYGEEDWTPLMFTCVAGRKKMSKMLMSKKTLVNAANKLGHTAFMLVVAKGDVEMALMLLKSRA